MKIRNDRILWIAAAAFYAVVLPVSGWMGMAVENSKAIQAESGMLQETEAGDGIDMAKATPAAAKGSGEVSGIGENGEENPMEETGAEGAGDSSDVISGELTLTPEQLDAVKRIDSALSSQPGSLIRSRTFWRPFFMKIWREAAIFILLQALPARLKERGWYLPCLEPYFTAFSKTGSPGGNVWPCSLST